MATKEVYKRAYRALRMFRGKLGIIYNNDTNEVYKMACLIKKKHLNVSSNSSLNRLRRKSYRKASNDAVFNKLFNMSYL